MRLRTRALTWLIAAITLAISGCASSGRVVPLQPQEMARLVGTWQGTVIYPNGVSWPATLSVYPNGTYAVEAGAFSARGSTQVKNGKLDFVNTESGPLTIGNRSGSATLVDQGSSWGLTGSGWATAGVFNFDFSKPK